MSRAEHTGVPEWVGGMTVSRGGRWVLTFGAVLVLLVAAAAALLPLLLQTAGGRVRIENALTEELGRKVTLGATHISVWTGSLLAEDASVADDPAFSRKPFLEARSVRIGVEVLPWLLHRSMHVRFLTMDRPRLQLLRSADGGWNYASLRRPIRDPARGLAREPVPGLARGPAGVGRPGEGAGPVTSPAFSLSEVTVSGGEITVRLGSEPARVYTGVDFRLKHPGLFSSSPFEATADLPGDGTLSVRGTAGPLRERSTAATRGSVHLELKHADLSAAGLLPASTGVSGWVDSLQLEAAWDRDGLHGTKLLMDGPHLTLARGGRPGPASNGQGRRSSFLSRLWLQDAEVSHGALRVMTGGRSDAPMVYTAIQARLTNLTPGSAAPFQLSAQTPGGGSLEAGGNVGPLSEPLQAWTPVDARVTLKHLRLGTAGLLLAGSGIDGLVDLRAQVTTRGQTLRASGEAVAAGIRLARDGTPSPQPLEVRFTMLADEGSKTVRVPDATVSAGGAVLQLSGSYGPGGPASPMDLHVRADAVPIDAVEAFLPAVGVRLPQGSRLRGGTLTASLAVTGTPAAPVIAGPVALDNTQLAGFNLGQKLAALSTLTGGQIGGATGPGTAIRSLRMEIRDASEGLATNQIALDVQGLGTATGEGTVSRGGALHYEMLVRLTELGGGPAAPDAAGGSGGGGGLLGLLSRSGLLGSLAGRVLKRGIPIEVGGTTGSPTFTPRL